MSPKYGERIPAERRRRRSEISPFAMFAEVKGAFSAKPAQSRYT